MIYLDNAATTLKKPECVKNAVINALCNLGNPSRGAYEPSLAAARIVYSARERLAELIGAENPSRIAFGSNATDALNTAIQGILTAGDHVITTVCEHNSVLRPLYVMEERGVSLTIVGADKKGRISYDELKGSIRENTRAIVLGQASNLTGNTVDLKRVRELIGGRKILLVADAAQSFGSISPKDLTAADIVCFTGHKALMGPMGTGGIYVREGVNIRPLKTGGSGIHSFSKAHPQDMPEALEAGTLNCHGIAGLLVALDFIREVGEEEIYNKEKLLAEAFLQGIYDIKGIKIYGDLSASPRVPVVTLNMEGISSSVLCDMLWTDYKICTRAGAHCAPLMHKTLGTEKSGAVRFSFSYFNTADEVKAAVLALKEIGKSIYD